MCNFGCKHSSTSLGCLREYLSFCSRMEGVKIIHAVISRPSDCTFPAGAADGLWGHSCQRLTCVHHAQCSAADVCGSPDRRSWSILTIGLKARRDTGGRRRTVRPKVEAPRGSLLMFVPVGPSIQLLFVADLLHMSENMDPIPSESTRLHQTPGWH